MLGARVLLCWSSGKDSAWTLHTLRQEGKFSVVALLTTVNESFDRVAMHAVRREVLEAQADAAGLPLRCVPIPWPCPNGAYEAAMDKALAQVREEFEITHVAFGDLFLEDVRAYREESLKGTGLIPTFPLWGIPTADLAREMVGGGLEAIVTCVDPRQIDRSFVARKFNARFLDDLPPGVDPCGERGEFHTFAYRGPMFSRALDPVVGEIVEREGFVFADVQLRTDSVLMETGEGPSIFDADGALSREFLVDRGYCCGNGCRNCPYGHEAAPR